MELWFTEEHTPNVRFSLRINRHLYQTQSKFQAIDIVETAEFGWMLLLDGLVMCTERDEAHYHEMITHIAAFTHPEPKSALVIGGGDGGTVRELLKHKSITSIDLVEIDREVVKACKEYLPQISAGLDNPRVKIYFEDGIEFVKRVEKKYDLALIDSFDPVGPAAGLFQKPFIEDVQRILDQEGVLVLQAESALYHLDCSGGVLKAVGELFPIAVPYWSYIPTYPSGQWIFILGSKKYCPLNNFRESEARAISGRLKYYNSEIHKAAFSLPNFVKMKYQGG